MGDTRIGIEMSQCIHKYVTLESLRPFVLQVFEATRATYPAVFTCGFYIPQCVSQIKYQTVQYIRQNQGIYGTPPHQVFGEGAVADTCRNIQKCIGTLVTPLMDTLVPRIYADKSSIMTNDGFDSMIVHIMEPMLVLLFNEKLFKPLKSKADSEYVWTAIGKLATIIDRYDRQSHES